MKDSNNEGRWKIVKMVKNNNITTVVNSLPEYLWKGRNYLIQRLEKLNDRKKKRSGKASKRRG